MSKPRCVNACIDIGGTNTRVAFIKDGEIENIYKFETQKDPKENFHMINQLLNDISFENIGVATVGPISKDLIYGKLPNLPTWEGFNLSNALNFNVPLFVENDANCSAVYENRKECKRTLFITVSTGIGSGFIVDNLIYKPLDSAGLELHKYIIPGIGSIESICSGTGIYNQAIAKGLQVKNAKDVFLIANSSQVAQNLIDDAKLNLVSMLNNVSITLNPECIVLGGSVISNNVYWFNEIKEELIKVLGDAVKIEMANAPDDNPLLGINKIIEENYEFEKKV